MPRPLGKKRGVHTPPARPPTDMLSLWSFATRYGVCILYQSSPAWISPQAKRPNKALSACRHGTASKRSREVLSWVVSILSPAGSSPRTPMESEMNHQRAPMCPQKPKALQGAVPALKSAPASTSHTIGRTGRGLRGDGREDVGGRERDGGGDTVAGAGAGGGGCGVESVS